ncbi:hypothetical protein VTK26DRAFT_3335 [Humicola hyalothermophila]
MKRTALGKKKYEQKLEWIVKKHLQYLKDPYNIAQHVSNALSKGSFDEALLMTRMASRNAKVEVSWNHLIDYQMKNKRLNAAIKLYNEMKKRAQIPNSKTYTIIFRGCADSIHPKLAVAEATRVYNFMIKVGALKPNTIHMNAVLEVCARAGDLESMFTVLLTANETMRAPDAHTYTIVLNALRYDSKSAEGRGLGLIDQDVRREIQKNIHRARALWEDVLDRWRSAKMLIDEPLVCAMGRVLTTGDYKDQESVLDLLEHTMQVPRLDKVSGSLPPAPKTEAESESTEPSQQNSKEKMPDIVDLSPRARRMLAASRPPGSPLLAQPGNKALSLALTALTNIRKTSHAAKYWDYFTKSLQVTPDRDNWYCYLRALAKGHASSQVAGLIEAMPAEILGPITFRVGFGACLRDNLNPDAFRNSVRIFEVMTAKQRYADPLAMRLFLQSARSIRRHFEELAEREPHKAKLAHGQQIVKAINLMWEPLRILTGSFSYPPLARRSPQEEMEAKRGDMQEAMSTARRMISAIDYAVNEGMVEDRGQLKNLRAQRIVLQRMVERYILKLYPDGKKKGLDDELDPSADHDESDPDQITYSSMFADVDSKPTVHL